MANELGKRNGSKKGKKQPSISTRNPKRKKKSPYKIKGVRKVKPVLLLMAIGGGLLRINNGQYIKVVFDSQGNIGIEKNGGATLLSPYFGKIPKTEKEWPYFFQVKRKELAEIMEKPYQIVNPNVSGINQNGEEIISFNRDGRYWGSSASFFINGTEYKKILTTKGITYVRANDVKEINYDEVEFNKYKVKENKKECKVYDEEGKIIRISKWRRICIFSYRF